MDQNIKNNCLPNTPQTILERYKKVADTALELDFGSLLENIVIVDCETTGVSFTRDHLTQIAATKIVNKERQEGFLTFVNPNINIPENIQRLTRITNEDVENAPSEEEALKQLVSFIGNSHILAHNVGFDKTFLTKVGTGKPLENNLWLDTLELTRIVFPRVKSHRLIDMMNTFGGPKSTHRADDDVTSTIYLYKYLLAGIYYMPTGLVEKIAKLATAEEWAFADIFKGIEKLQKERNVSRETISIKAKREDTKTKRQTKEINKENQISLPSDEYVMNLYEKEGILGRSFKNYKRRNAQVEMSLAILENFRKGGNLIIEAPTGVGKTLAYLSVCNEVARRNNIIVGIATKTNALLDQLSQKDLPTLYDARNCDFKFCEIKGISHYICLRKLNKIIESGEAYKNIGDQKVLISNALATILSFIEQSGFDDIDSLKMNFKEIPTKSITTTSIECHKKRCPFFEKGCHFREKQREAESCDILITNHSMLLADIATDGGLLPTVKHWIVDEAHGFEEEARNSLAIRISESEIKNIAEICSSVKKKTCIFTSLKKNFNNKSADNLFYSLLNRCENKGDVVAIDIIDLAIKLREMQCFDKNKKSSYEVEDVWISEEDIKKSEFSNFSSQALKVKDSLAPFLTSLQDMVAFLEDYNNMKYYQAELSKLAFMVRDLHNDIKLLIEKMPIDYVYSLTIARRNNKTPFSLNGEYIDVGEVLNKKFYKNLDSLVMCSATLTANRKFDYFEKSVGLPAGENIFDHPAPETFVFGKDISDFENEKEVDALERRENKKTFELALKSSFNLNRNMKVFVAVDISKPEKPGSKCFHDHIEDLGCFIARAIEAKEGSMLVLFTSRAEMEGCFEVCKKELQNSSLQLICQSKGASTKYLADEFLRDETSSLFALKSFWEGFDAPGKTLRGVIIAKLPFSLPTDPLSRERQRREGDYNAFMKYSVPKVITEVQQAAGRLLRNEEDKGVVIIADSRCASSSYGKMIMNSMPTDDVCAISKNEIIEALFNF